MRFLRSNATILSVSAGIVADTLGRCQSVREQGSSRQSRNARADASWIGAWLKSADKVLSFMSAFDLEATTGIPVSSYGHGSAQYQCPTTATEELIRIGAEIGMIPRTDCIPEGFSWSSSSWGGDKKSLVLTTMMMMKRKSIVLGLDKIMLAPESERKAAMDEIFATLRQS